MVRGIMDTKKDHMSVLTHGLVNLECVICMLL